MCGGGPRPKPRDLQAEQAEADRVSTREANKEIASRRSRRRQSSLIANPFGRQGLSAINAISSRPTGKDTLG